MIASKKDRGGTLRAVLFIIFGLAALAAFLMADGSRVFDKLGGMSICRQCSSAWEMFAE